MIKQLRIKNFKCLKDIDISLGNFNVFIGPNNTGKTSLLNALTLFGQTAVLHPNDILFYSFFEKIRWRGENSSEIQLGMVSNDGLDYSITFASDKEGKTILKDESLSSHGEKILTQNEHGQWVFKKEVKGKKDSGLHTFLYDGKNYIHVSPECKEASQVANILSNIQLFTLKTSELAKDSYIEPDCLNNPQMNTSGYGLPSILSKLASSASSDDNRYQKIKEYLKQAIPEITNFGIDLVPVTSKTLCFRYPKDKNEDVVLNKRELYTVTGQSLYFEIKGSKQKVPASLMSDGVLLILGYLTLVYTTQSPSILLIEEPENGIHPKLLEFVVKLLHDLSRGLGSPQVQVILTTHSPYLLDFAKPEEVFIFQKDKEGASVITPMSKVAGIEDWLSEYMLGELWYNWGEEEFVQRAQK